MANINLLPDEIINLILINLIGDYNFLIDSIRFGQTCKRFRALVDQPTLWSLRLPSPIPACFKEYVNAKEYLMHFIHCMPYAAIEIDKIQYPLLTIHCKLLQFKFMPSHICEVFYSTKLRLYISVEYYMTRVTSIYILQHGQKIEFKKTSPNCPSLTIKMLLFFRPPKYLA